MKLTKQTQRNLIGKKWNTLSEEMKTALLSDSKVYELENIKETTACIIDLTEYLSVTGTVEVSDDEIVVNIDKNASIYNCCEIA